MWHLVAKFLIILRLVYWNNKHTIAKVRKNANRRGGKNATVTKWQHWWQLLNENEKKTFKIQNIKAKCRNAEHSKTQLGTGHDRRCTAYRVPDLIWYVQIRVTLWVWVWDCAKVRGLSDSELLSIFCSVGVNHLESRNTSQVFLLGRWYHFVVLWWRLVIRTDDPNRQTTDRTISVPCR